MDRRTQALGVHLQRQVQEHDKQLRIYEALAAHDLYNRLSSAGYEEVVILKAGDGSLWIDEADRKPLDHRHTDQAHSACTARRGSQVECPRGFAPVLG